MRGNPTLAFRAPALAGLLPCTRQAIQGNCSPVRERMQKFVDDGEIAGAVTVVGREDGVVHHEAVGYRDLEAKDADGEGHPLPHRLDDQADHRRSAS